MGGNSSSCPAWHVPLLCDFHREENIDSVLIGKERKGEEGKGEGGREGEYLGRQLGCYDIYTGCGSE